MKQKIILDPLTGTLHSTSDTDSLDSRITTLENKYVITTRFAEISAGTSGSVSLPANSTVRLDDFGGTVDAIIAQMSGGKPTNDNAYTSSGVLITTTFDASGNYVLSGTPSAYPVAIIYRVTTKLVDFNSSDSSIVGDVEYIIDPIPQETHIEGLTFEGPIQSNVLVTALQKTAHAIYEAGRSGLTTWAGSGNYWSWTPGNPGTFTLLRGGEGYIRHKEVFFNASQTVTLAYGDYMYLYIDGDGLLQKSTTNSAEDKRSRINLFIAQNDVNGEFLAIRNDHRFTLDNGAREWMDSGFGCVLGSEPGASDISRYGTGTGASTTDRMANISAGRLIDADIVESWSAVTTGIDVNHTYRRNDGFFARDSKSQQFPMKYNLSGTPTALTNGEFGVYRLFMLKSSLNDNPPQFVSEMHTAKFANVVQAQTAIASGTISNFGAFNNELAQVGYVIVAMNASGGYIHSVQIEKTTFRQTTGGSGVGSTASNVVTDTALFDKVLSAADTTVQAALNTIDENAVSVDKTQTISGAKTFSSLATFSAGTKNGFTYPATDSATAWQVRKADGTTAVLNIDTTNSRVGIGTTAPQDLLHVAKDSRLSIYFSTYENSADPTNVLVRKARGTQSAPLVVQDGDSLGSLSFQGYSGLAGFHRAACSIVGAVDGEPDSSGDTTDMPGRLMFYTVPDGGSGLVERIRITNAGDVGVGTTTPTCRFNVYSTAALVSEFATNSTDATVVFLKNTSTGSKNWGLGVAGPSNLGGGGAVGNFYIRNETDASVKFVIEPGGEIGIGTAAPGHKLDVAGGDVNIADTYGYRSSGEYLIGRTASTNIIRIGSGVVADKVAIYAGGEERMLIDSDGDVAVGGNFSSANVLSGTYTPTITRDANLDATTAYACIYCRVGNVVTVSGEFAADPTSASAATAFRMTLPIASNFSATGDCSGTANGQAASANPWNITPSTSTDQAIFACPSPGVTGNTGFSFIFQYIIK